MRRVGAIRRSWHDRLARLFRYRLLIPIKRSQHPPEHAARGVAVGVAWALTPTMGIQMPLCLVTWLIARRFLKWDFSVLLAMAWTWVTNVVTVLPAYYVFYLTGQVLLGRTRRLPEYGEFVGLWQENVGEEGLAIGEPGFLVNLWTYLVALFEGWGAPMLVGCIPWAIAGGWLAYVLSLRFTRRHREYRHQRRLARLRGERPHSKIADFIHEHDPFHRRHRGPGEAKAPRPARDAARAPESGKSG